MSVVAGPRDDPVCPYPYVGNGCSDTIASRVYYSYYLPSQIGCLALGSLATLASLRLLLTVGKKTGWNWNSYQLQLCALGLAEIFLGMTRAVDPLGWAGIVPGSYDAGVNFIRCSVATGLVQGNMIRSMAKVSASFSQSFDNSQMFKFSIQAEQVVYHIQCFKNLADLVLLILCCVEKNNTWVYYITFTVVSNTSVGICAAYLHKLGKYLTEMMSANVEKLGSNSEERKVELQQLETMIKTVKNAEISYIVLSWFPASWYAISKANFTTNPPMVPRNFYDYFARFWNVWIGFLPGGLGKMMDDNIKLVSGKDYVDREVRLWFVDVTAGKRRSDSAPASPRAVSSNITTVSVEAGRSSEKI
eukprot:TRINITY_DN13412_c0_g1_i1.p1 TRINITY_DN13412_c0_g1~~TRINITY_DN13412_c0_g1_i1.p1  ORF type:complete len:360 (+),score=87.16 TRINITY_DN13412_c0_g1_i1:94-1173(+)